GRCLAIRLKWQRVIGPSGRSGQHLENPREIAPERPQLIAQRAIGQRGELLVGRLGRLRLLGAQLTTGAGQRQPFDENQVLDPEDALDVGAAVEPRTVGGLRDTEIRELRLPRAEHVRLYLGNLAHLARAKHRAVRNFDGFHGLSPRVCRPKYSSYRS